MKDNVQLEDNSRVDMLNQAFSAFSETTVKFQEAYTKLEEHIAYLSKELTEKNNVLNRKIAELDQTHKYLNNILESISDGVIALDLNGEIRTFNKAAQKITRFSAAEMIGKHYSEIFSTWRREPDGTYNVVREVAFPTGQETTIKCKSGERIPVVMYTSLITDENAHVIGIVITFNDLTKIKQLEDEIERGKRLTALGEMAAGVAHEIRNPLGGIEMFASLLERESANDERKRKISQKIIQGVRSLNKIISELLTFTRTFGKTEFKKVDMVDCLDSSLGFIHHEFSERHVKVLKTYPPRQSVMVMGDVDQLRQVFLNILLNAAQAINHAHGTTHIQCQAHERDGYVVVEVTDNGCGISLEQREKIFDPFFTTKSSGTGLGLAVSYRIIEAHGGKIHIKSEEQQGTTFSIYLPLVQGV